jgi:hypothetical protein
MGHIARRVERATDMKLMVAILLVVTLSIVPNQARCGATSLTKSRAL